MKNIRIPPAHAVAFELAAGEKFHVIDPEGKQVSDLVAFNREVQVERFSPKYTHAKAGRIRITDGDSLYTTKGNPILTIKRDDCGVHDIVHGPGTSWLLTELEGREDPIRGCHENLFEVLSLWGVDKKELFDVMNIFMKSIISDQIYVDVREPESDPGDTIVFEADMDSIVAVTACASKSITNAGETTHIEVLVPENVNVNKNFDNSFE